MGLETIASMIGANRLLQRHPQVNILTLFSHYTHWPKHPLYTSPTFIDQMRSLLVDTSPIGCPVTFSKLVVEACIMSLRF
jgi:hypothetical protein